MPTMQTRYKVTFYLDPTDDELDEGPLMDAVAAVGGYDIEIEEVVEEAVEPTRRQKKRP